MHVARVGRVSRLGVHSFLPCVYHRRSHGCTRLTFRWLHARGFGSRSSTTPTRARTTTWTSCCCDAWRMSEWEHTHEEERRGESSIPMATPQPNAIHPNVKTVYPQLSEDPLGLFGRSEPTEFGRWVQWTSVLMAGVLGGGFRECN